MSPCPWCHEESAAVAQQRRDRWSAQRFQYLRCDRCGLLRLDPRPAPEEMARHYPQEYECFQDGGESWLFRLGWQRLWSRRVRAVLRHWPSPAPGRVLDVGCATGEFLGAMQRRGWSVCGIEPDPSAARRAQQRLGEAAVQVVSLEEAALPEGTFDLITLWDVLEHLPDPLAALGRLAQALRPGGLLAAGVPNLESWDARFFGSSWIGWDAPRHFFLFPDRVMRDLSAAVGLPVFATRCFYGDYGAFILSLDLALEERFGKGPRGQAWRRLAGLRPWRYLLWPYFRLAELLNRGPIRTYFCRRVYGASRIQRDSDLGISFVLL